MCTVSFVTCNNRFYLTSNRDEHRSRPLALEPKEEMVNGCRLAYPKDQKAGGTWFSINEHGDVAVLLNGAFKKHDPKGPYAKSRGLVLLDIISSKNPLFYIEYMDLGSIEPFTVVLLSNNRLIEFRWDGLQKHRKHLSVAKNHIWSSATLYSPQVVLHREALFGKFLDSTQNIMGQDIIDFHSTNNGDQENGFVIDRRTGLKTFSVTQAIVGDEEILLHHIDLLNATKNTISFVPNQLIKQLT